MDTRRLDVGLGLVVSAFELYHEIGWNNVYYFKTINLEYELKTLDLL